MYKLFFKVISTLIFVLIVACFCGIVETRNLVLVPTLIELVLVLNQTIGAAMDNHKKK